LEKDASQMTLKLFITLLHNIPSLIGIFSGRAYIIDHTKITRIFTLPTAPKFPPFVKLVFPYVSVQYYHDPEHNHNSQTILRKTVERMMQTLKPQAVHRRVLLTKTTTTNPDHPKPQILSKNANSNNNSSDIATAHSTNSTLAKGALEGMHRAKVLGYSAWTNLVAAHLQHMNTTNDSSSNSNNGNSNQSPLLDSDGNGRHEEEKQLEQCVHDISQQLRCEISACLKAPRTSRNIDTEVDGLEAKRKKIHHSLGGIHVKRNVIAK